MRREHVAVKTPIGALNLTHSSHVYRHAFTELLFLFCKSTNKKASFSVKNSACRQACEPCRATRENAQLPKIMTKAWGPIPTPQKIGNQFSKQKGETL